MELSQAVQAESERRGGEMDSARIYRVFAGRFLHDQGPYRLLGYRLTDAKVAEIEKELATRRMTPVAVPESAG